MRTNPAVKAGIGNKTLENEMSGKKKVSVKEIEKKAEEIVETLVGKAFKHGSKTAVVTSVDDKGMCIAAKKPPRTRVKCPDVAIRVTPQYVEANQIG